MKIRSITYFTGPGLLLSGSGQDLANKFVSKARGVFETAGYEVQTVRLATSPFPAFMTALEPKMDIERCQEIESAAISAGFDYISLGPALPDDLNNYPLILDFLSSTENVFATGSMTVDGQISLSAVRACAEVIYHAARITMDGFTNLRFAALANVQPGIPFFPAAYHEQDRKPAFGLAMESADLVNQVVGSSKNLHDLRETLIMEIESHSRELEEIARSLSSDFDVYFNGIDFTTAPFPRKELSFGTAIERMGVESVGLHGTLAAAAFLADTLDKARFRKAGFNGLFFPVLEDVVLANSAASGILTVKDLLLFSAVCGSGLDTIPLQGDISVDEIYAILLDVVFLSTRLKKPLTARLMPIPGKMAGDPTEFHFEYFANSRVMTAQASALGNSLTGDDVIPVSISNRQSD